jgi:predicted nucleotidyltransferase
MDVKFTNKDLEKLKEIAVKYHIDLVVLFGSFAKGRAIKESDVDIAVFRKGQQVSYIDQISLSGEFNQLFKNNNIDISVISSNNPVLMFNILRNGKVLYQEDSNLFDGLKLYSWKLLVESKYFRDRSFSLLKKRISSYV